MPGDTIKVVTLGSLLQLAGYGWQRLLGDSDKQAFVKEISAVVLANVADGEDFVFSTDTSTVLTLVYIRKDGAHYIIEKGVHPARGLLLVENEKPWLRQYLDDAKQKLGVLDPFRIEKMIDSFSDDRGGHN